MKTIFVTISRGYLARNILETGIVDRLLAAGHRVILLTPAFQDAKFLERFGRENCVMEPLAKGSWRPLDRFFVGLQRGLAYNAMSDLVSRYGVYDGSETSWIKWVAHRTVFGILSKIRPLRIMARWLDERLCPDRDHGALFDRYHPDLVFATNIMEDADGFVLRAAKARGIPTVGMPKSWDNLSKMVLRTKPDRLIVWSPYMRDEAKRFQDYHDEEIMMTGIPQFDGYVTRSGLPSREDFFSAIGADPSKKLILFASEAKLSPPDPSFCEMLLRALDDGRIGNAQLLVRPHFGFREDVKRFLVFQDRPFACVDTDFDPQPVFYDAFDYSHRHMMRLAASLLYADVVVTTFSTMTLDATACGKPVVNAMFDGFETLPFGKSIRRWFTSEHYRPVVETNAPFFVRTEDELIATVRSLLERPDQHLSERTHLQNHFIGTLDGHASERVAQAVLHMFTHDRSGRSSDLCAAL